MTGRVNSRRDLRKLFANSSPASGERGPFNKSINVLVSVGYDTDHLFNVRPGIHFEF